MFFHLARNSNSKYSFIKPYQIQHLSCSNPTLDENHFPKTPSTKINGLNSMEVYDNLIFIKFRARK